MEDRIILIADEKDVLEELQTYQPLLDEFHQRAVSTSKRIYPYLYQIYKESVDEVERRFPK